MVASSIFISYASRANSGVSKMVESASAVVAESRATATFFSCTISSAVRSGGIFLSVSTKRLYRSISAVSLAFTSA